MVSLYGDSRGKKAAITEDASLLKYRAKGEQPLGGGSGLQRRAQVAAVPPPPSSKAGAGPVPRSPAQPVQQQEYKLNDGRRRIVPQALANGGPVLPAAGGGSAAALPPMPLPAPVAAQPRRIVPQSTAGQKRKLMEPPIPIGAGGGGGAGFAAGAVAAEMG